MKSGVIKKQLSDKQKRFCEEYAVDLNGTQAAIRAGYSPKTSNEQASALLAKPNIRSYCDELIEKKRMISNINADTILRNIERIASTAEKTGDNSAALKGNELLGKYLKLFTDKIEQSGTINLVVSTNIPSKKLE